MTATEAELEIVMRDLAPSGVVFVSISRAGVVSRGHALKVDNRRKSEYLECTVNDGVTDRRNRELASSFRNASRRGKQDRYDTRVDEAALGDVDEYAAW